MGVVNVPLLVREGMDSEIRLWKEGIEGGGEEQSNAPYIGNVLVDGEFRRRGIGRRLMVRAVEMADGWGKDEVWLHVEEGNERAKEFYKRLGFECALREPEWYERIGRTRRLLLRGGVGKVGGGESSSGGGGGKDWNEAKVGLSKLRWWQYVRYCWYDLSVRRNESAKL